MHFAGIIPVRALEVHLKSKNMLDGIGSNPVNTGVLEPRRAKKWFI